MNDVDKSFMNSAKWWFVAVVIMLMGYALTVEASEVETDEFIDKNATGLFFKMNHTCELFDPMTGEVLDDSNKSKCPVWFYKEGVALRPASDEEVQEYEDNESMRERMYK